MKKEHIFKMPGGYTAAIYNEYDVDFLGVVTTVYVTQVRTPDGYVVETIDALTSLEAALKVSGELALADYKNGLGVLSMAAKLDRLEASGWTE